MGKCNKPAWLQQDKEYYEAIKNNIKMLVYQALDNDYHEYCVLPGLSFYSSDEKDLLQDCLINGFISGIRQYLNEYGDFCEGLSVHGVLTKIGLNNDWKKGDDLYRGTIYKLAFQVIDEISEEKKRVASDSEIIYAINALKPYSSMLQHGNIKLEGLKTAIETKIEGKKVDGNRLRDVCQKNNILIVNDEVFFEDSFWSINMTEKDKEETKSLSFTFGNVTVATSGEVFIGTSSGGGDIGGRIYNINYDNNLGFKSINEFKEFLEAVGKLSANQQKEIKQNLNDLVKVKDKGEIEAKGETLKRRLVDYGIGVAASLTASQLFVVLQKIPW